MAAPLEDLKAFCAEVGHGWPGNTARESGARSLARLNAFVPALLLGYPA
jgi:hypothetical protein